MNKDFEKMKKLEKELENKKRFNEMLKREVEKTMK